MAPLCRGRPGQLTRAVEEGLERLVAGDAADEIEPEALGSLGGLGGDDLKGECQGLVDAVGIRIPEPADRHLTVDVITAVQVSKGGKEPAGQIVAQGDPSKESRRLAVELIDSGVLVLQQPLSEVEEKRDTAGAVARKDLGALGRLGVLAAGTATTKAIDAAGLKDRAVKEELAEGLIQCRGGFAGRLLQPSATRSGGQTQVQLQRFAATAQ